MLRLFAALAVVGTIFVLSPARTGPLPTPPDRIALGLGLAAAGSTDSGLRLVGTVASPALRPTLRPEERPGPAARQR